MISKQQIRLLTLFVLTFGLLTVPVILILIYLVPSDDTSTVSAAVIQNQVTIDTPVRNAYSADTNREIDPASNKIASKIENHQAIKPTERLSNTAMFAGNWVVVDCAQRIVVQCPHQRFTTGASPRPGKPNPVFQSYCRDVSIKLDSFCRL